MGTFWFTVATAGTSSSYTSAVTQTVRGHTDLELVTAVDAENPTIHDLRLRDGQLEWVGVDLYDAEDQAAAIAQRAKQNLLLIRREWYQDMKIGVPWRETLLTKGTTDAQIVATIRKALEATAGIASVGTITITRDNVARSVAVTFQAVADAGYPVGPITLDVPFVMTET